MLYAEIIGRLQEAGVDFLIIGGTAVNLHGFNRYTNDLDLMLRMDSENLLKTVRVLLDAGFTTWLPIAPEKIADDETRHRWLTEKNMKSLAFKREKDKIDLVFAAPIPYEELSREEFKIGRFLYPVASKNDLIRLKEGTGRRVDEEDIAQLKVLIRLEGKRFPDRLLKSGERPPLFNSTQIAIKSPPSSVDRSYGNGSGGIDEYYRCHWSAELIHHGDE